MGMLNKLKAKLDETKAELGLGSRPGQPSQQHYQPPPPGHQYPGQPYPDQQYGHPGGGQSYHGYPPQNLPPAQGYPQLQHHHQQAPGQPAQPYYGPPGAYYSPPAQSQYRYPPPGHPPQNWGQPQPPPSVPASSRPDLPAPPIPSRPAGFETAPPAIPPRPQEPEDETTPPGSPRPELDNCRPVSPFPEHTSEGDGDDDGEEPELTEEEIWDGIPSAQIVIGPNGRRDPLGGQVTGHERHLHCDPVQDANMPTKVIGLYYPEWRVYLNRPPSSMREDLATHIYYAFAVPQPSGYIGYMDYYAATQKDCDNTSGCLNAMRRLRWRYPNLKLILSCGGGTSSENFKYIAATSWKRVRFAKSVRSWLRKYQLNGVDIDWEFPDDAVNGANYILLLRTLRAYLPRPQYQITSALPAGEWVLKNIDLRTASYYLDYLNLMCYDMAGPWSSKSGHQAALHATGSDPSAVSCDKAVGYLVSRGFPRWKIVLGIPNYAQYFPNASRTNDDFDKSKAGQIEYRELNYWWRKNANVDTAAVAAWHLDHEKGFVSFDTPQTVQLKASYIKSQGLAGMFFWHAVGDVWGGLSLVSAGYQALNG